LKTKLIKIGGTCITGCRTIGEMTMLFGEAMWYTRPWGRRGLRTRECIAQMARLGVNSLPLICLVNFLVGAIIAISLADLLREFGILSWISVVVGVAHTRELGPVMTALTMTGLAGAAITAELGTMTVSEEIIALKSQALNPIYFLIAPRLLAMLLMMPCLVIAGDVVGMIGGAVIGIFMLGIDPTTYAELTFSTISNTDLLRGVIIKAEVFGAIIAVVACYMGLYTRNGAEGVGQSTTKSVVWSIVLIILANLILTVLFNYVLSSGGNLPKI
jgi:phospholipid/cholesterol/gamma-HCH transport system permease protein